MSSRGRAGLSLVEGSYEAHRINPTREFVDPAGDAPAFFSAISRAFSAFARAERLPRVYYDSAFARPSSSRADFDERGTYVCELDRCTFAFLSSFSS